MEKQLSISIGPEVKGETRVRRSVLSPNELLTTPADGVTTLYEVLQYSVKTFGDKRCMGYRTIEKVVEEEKEVTKIVNGQEHKEKKIWKYFQLSSFTYLSYVEVAEHTKWIGAGLVKLGVHKNAKVTVFASTSINWMLFTHGCFEQGITIVTAYDTLGEQGLLHSMNESEVQAIFTNADLFPVVKKVIEKIPTLELLVYDGNPDENVLKELKALVPKIRFIALEDLKQLGKDNPTEPNPPTSQDFCCIMYTSGSTGNPKGVMLTHANLVAAIAGVERMLQTFVRPDDTLLAYLPLAHVLEFVVEHTCIWWGVTMGYGNTRTLTDASVRNCAGDIREFKPSLLTGVPAVWESIRKGILTKVHAGSPTLQRVFNTAFKTKRWLQNKGLPTKVLDTAIFNKVREQTGGRLRLALSGGAPIAQETQEFLTVTLCPILQGYGMTETCGMCTILPPEQFRYESTGAPVPCLEIKLVDVPDAGYLSKNKPRPQGEIWIRGGCVTSGYYKNEQITKETFTEDRWLQTGDIGEWLEDGTLAIIDRKKNLVKLSHGEYIALEKLESIYKSTIFVSNICVHADPLQNRPVALIFPVEAQILNLAKEKNISGLSFEQLCENKEITGAVLQACLTQAKKSNLKPVELLSAVTLTPEEWNPQNGLLTAAHKIKRKEIGIKYKEAIDRMYGKA
ncbi:681_t:CDS:2 [Acaulospora morrowiae]|uniref:681_t:CDS:1 n=1 Tax=Acaulospora morrowiae TaxID=94023 RepID=A0A9N9GAL0_9GLOM|nr:681_t:CDS:2 [Acaulospora morrowiae]